MAKWLADNIGLVTAIVGLITVFAIFYAPIVALRVQKKIEKFNEQTQRQLNVFKTLLAHASWNTKYGTGDNTQRVC